jgi:hypothetical protein
LWTLEKNCRQALDKKASNLVKMGYQKEVHLVFTGVIQGLSVDGNRFGTSGFESTGKQLSRQ